MTEPASVCNPLGRRTHDANAYNAIGGVSEIA